MNSDFNDIIDVIHRLKFFNIKQADISSEPECKNKNISLLALTIIEKFEKVGRNLSRLSIQELEELTLIESAASDTFTSLIKTHLDVSDTFESCLDESKKMGRKIRETLISQEIQKELEKGAITAETAAFRHALLTGEVDILKAFGQSKAPLEKDFEICCMARKNQMECIEFLFEILNRQTEESPRISFSTIERQAIKYENANVLLALQKRGHTPRYDVLIKLNKRDLIQKLAGWSDQNESREILHRLCKMIDLFPEPREAVDEIIACLLHHNLMIDEWAIMNIAHFVGDPALIRQAIDKGLSEGTINYQNLAVVYRIAKMDGLDVIEKRLDEATDGVLKTIDLYQVTALRFSLTGLATIGPDAIPIDLEGYADSLALGAIIESIQSYRWLQDFPSTLESLAVTNSNPNPDDMATRFNMGKPCALLTGWKGHVTGLILKKMNEGQSLLIKCDKGEGAEGYPGFKIYEINAVDQINPSFMKQFLAELVDPITGGVKWVSEKVEKSYFQKQIDRELKLRPLAAFITKEQKADNCPFATSKLLLRGLMYLEEIERARKMPGCSYFWKFSYISKSDPCRVNVDTVYKGWRRFDLISHVTTTIKKIQDEKLWFEEDFFARIDPKIKRLLLDKPKTYQMLQERIENMKRP